MFSKLSKKSIRTSSPIIKRWYKKLLHKFNRRKNADDGKSNYGSMY